jgi:hypothetical protein
MPVQAWNGPGQGFARSPLSNLYGSLYAGLGDILGVRPEHRAESAQAGRTRVGSLLAVRVDCTVPWIGSCPGCSQRRGRVP